MSCFQTANLPVEQQQRLHPEFLANEQSYHRLRDDLLRRYRGQWVAVDGGRVVAAGTDLHSVLEEASSRSSHPFIARVGEEANTVFRVRREEFAYDMGIARGVLGASVTTLIYRGKAEINARRLGALIQPDPGGTERLVGRDVLNQHRVVFDGPAGRVVFEP